MNRSTARGTSTSAGRTGGLWGVLPLTVLRRGLAAGADGTTEVGRHDGAGH